jgi:hypothetical protein
LVSSKSSTPSSVRRQFTAESPGPAGIYEPLRPHPS